MGVGIQAVFASKVGLATHQNAVPVLRELDLVYRRAGVAVPSTEGAQADDPTLAGLILELVAEPAFIAPRSWEIKQLAPGELVQIADRDIRLDAGYLSGLTETLRAEVRLTLRHGDTVLDVQRYPVDVLARQHWGGSSSMPELLAAFSMPNDPAVDRILKAASDVLRAAGKPDGIDGYAGQSRTRTWELASAIWSAVAGMGISYALPPVGFERHGQKIRSPGDIREGGVATCLDLALLFTAALEQAGLNSLLILTDGHAFTGVWLQPQEFAQLFTDEAAAVRKRIDLQEMVAFETTLAAQAQPATFNQAIAQANRQITDHDFLMAIDLRRARLQRILPLAVVMPASAAAQATEHAPAVAMDMPPDLPGFDVDIDVHAAFESDRLALWQRKLLDLTTRNRLLHVPPGAKAVRLLCPDPAALEDRLADGKRVRVVPMPDLAAAGRDAALYEKQTRENLQEQYARDALVRGEVVALLEPARLDTVLIDLFRKARSDLDEGGANTLFLALGFLKWKKTPSDPRQYSAPLILLPVRLERKTVSGGVTMSLSDDEPRFNLTLLELLRHDFGLVVSGLDGELASDGRGIDVEAIWNIVRRAVRDLPGFEVTGELVLGTFSFAKYLMWKDLAERTDDLRQSALVRHLLAAPEENTEAQPSVHPASIPAALTPDALDTQVAARDMFLPLPTDSSQLAAVMASAGGRDFVLDGPPGTGKSQTIANMIAHNLALGRRVLFVAEKMAALDVVNRRLEAHGLGEFCLELHSNKTSKVEVIKQLERAWDVRESLAAEQWQAPADAVQALQDKLNAWVDVLHRPSPAGMSVHDAIGRVVRDGSGHDLRLSWPAGTVHTAEQLAGMREAAKRLDLNGDAARTLQVHFHAIAQPEWSNAWQEAFVQASAQAVTAVQALAHAYDAAKAALKLPQHAQQGHHGASPPSPSGAQHGMPEAAQHRTPEEAQHSTPEEARHSLPGEAQHSTPSEVQHSMPTEAQAQSLVDLIAAMQQAHGLDASVAFAVDVNAKLASARQALDILGQRDAAMANLSVSYPARALRDLAPAALRTKWEAACAKFWFLATLAKRRVTRDWARATGAEGTPDIQADLPVLQTLSEQADALHRLQPALAGFPGWAGMDSDRAVMSRAIDAAQGMRDSLATLAPSADLLPVYRQAVSGVVLHSNELLGPQGPFAHVLAALVDALRTYRERASAWLVLAGAQHAVLPAALRDWAQAVTTHRHQLKSWCDWRRAEKDAHGLGLAGLTQAVLDASGAGQPPAARAQHAFEIGYARWFAALAMDADPLLRNFVSAEHASDIARYRELLDSVAALSVRYTRARLCADIPPKNDVAKRSGYGVLKHELQKSRRHKPIRQLALEMGDALHQLAPCMLMSPLSIAQFLPPDQALFDLVIFDEASQIAPWDAIGSIARGKQVVIAGDPRQMPPTSFFNRAASAEDDDTEEDMESILDQCLATGVVSRSLDWHYRSRHESLIAFSNHRYYDSALITFPAAVTRQSAVQWRRVPGVYAKGQGRNNVIEAQAMVDETVARLTDPAFVAAGHSIGIITLNSEQQTLVADLLDQARQAHPEIEVFFQDDRREPVVVKNLETVQGDERDVILLGIGYGPTGADEPTMSMNFGPLNKEGGWRRLNVAITRARREMLVFSSFDPTMIDLNRTSARAVRDLKQFIAYAQHGPGVLADATRTDKLTYGSMFEEAVARGLREKGWTVVPQVGVSRFRVNLGIVHPDQPHVYLAGIECDGPSYRDAATARDRDQVRAAVLEGLGWQLLRVWSTDWWVDPAGALDRLHAQVDSLLARN